MIPTLPLLPIPVEGEEVPPVFGVLFAIAGVAVLGVLIWRTRRFFRDDRDDRDR